MSSTFNHGNHGRIAVADNGDTPDNWSISLILRLEKAQTPVGELSKQSMTPIRAMASQGTRTLTAHRGGGCLPTTLPSFARAPIDTLHPSGTGRSSAADDMAPLTQERLQVSEHGGLERLDCSMWCAGHGSKGSHLFLQRRFHHQR